MRWIELQETALTQSDQCGLLPLFLGIDLTLAGQSDPTSYTGSYDLVKLQFSEHERGHRDSLLEHRELFLTVDMETRPWTSVIIVLLVAFLLYSNNNPSSTMSSYTRIAAVSGANKGWLSIRTSL